MTEQQGSDEVEGHRRHFFEDPEETGTTETPEDDTEGHGARFKQEEGSADDVAGHKPAPAAGRRGTEDDDVEGHSNVARRPL